MMTAPPGKRRLSAEQRRAVAILADAGRNGVAEAIKLANGFKPQILAHLDREMLATAMSRPMLCGEAGWISDSGDTPAILQQ